jgi:hypothetical protein
MEHRSLLAALRAKDAPDLVAITQPGIELKLQAAASAFEGVYEDAFPLLYSHPA